MIGVVATTANNLMVNYFMLFWDECVFVAVRIKCFVCSEHGQD